ncbi:MAG: NepR family anti-sigma factor [Pseudomonadota bacterium]
MASGSSEQGNRPAGVPDRSTGAPDASQGGRAGERLGAQANDDEPHQNDRGAADANEAQQPDWANGLRQLYDSVVDEPLPDSFKDLLAQFDDDDDAGDPTQDPETRH